jgi:hypothetical protein
LNFDQLMNRYSVDEEGDENTRSDDQSQINAIHQTCLNRFSLIQGTGKTYIGVQLANYILNSSSSSHQNHALDSFMESIIDSNGIQESFVKRLGRHQKHQIV